MLKAIIIDDEASARETLIELINSYSTNVKIIAEASSISAGLEVISLNKPDVVFLDIKMPPSTGFDLLEKLPEINFEIIFTTAYDRYALKAFRFSALDYLLKPINPNELREALEKVKKRKQHHHGHAQKSFQIYHENKTSGSFSKIALPTSNGLLVTELNEIIRFEGIKSYTAIVLANHPQIVVSRKLKDFEEMLEGYNFIRIFQSHLVNVLHINQYHRGRGGQVFMSDQSVLPVSRERKHELLSKLESLLPKEKLR